MNPSTPPRRLALSLILLIASILPGRAADNLKAFPPAEDGMVRHVLNLPEKADESAHQIELIAGKTVPVDERNRYFFSGRIKAETIKGWGFTKYQVGPLGPMAGTRMAVDPATPKVDRFISLGGEPYLIRYNSKLPVVVYAPRGVEIRYRIWSTPPESTPMKEG